MIAPSRQNILVTTVQCDVHRVPVVMAAFRANSRGLCQVKQLVLLAVTAPEHVLMERLGLVKAKHLSSVERSGCLVHALNVNLLDLDHGVVGLGGVLLASNHLLVQSHVNSDMGVGLIGPSNPSK